MAVAKWLVFKLTLVGKELCNTKKMLFRIIKLSCTLSDGFVLSFSAAATNL